MCVKDFIFTATVLLGITSFLVKLYKIFKGFQLNLLDLVPSWDKYFSAVLQRARCKSRLQVLQIKQQKQISSTVAFTLGSQVP